jgi:CBS domain-containing protein
MKPVLELLKKREAKVYSLTPDISVFDALKRLADHNVGDDRLVGVFSERDYTRKIALAGKSSKETKVSDIMTAKVLSVSPQTRTRECMALMSQNKIRHLPIVDGGKVLGMISIRDIMNDIIADHELTISQLQNYISN